MKTKIIATIGPATLDFGIFNKVVHEGVDFLRINTAYGNYNQYNLILNNLKQSNKKDIKVIFDIKKLDVLDYFVRNNLSMVAVSFTESKKQLENVREKVNKAFIISKIESKQGVENFEEILEVSDGVMVARGDLGEAVSLEKVPCLQKRFTQRTLEKGKFLIAATEMLLSMTEDTTPTRAEVSDVANAVFDGASAVMLSEETAIGKYPVESVRYMRKIIKEAEECLNSDLKL